MKTTLVVLAAGIGSRFKGGIKQIAPVGPNSQLLLEYSVYDAIRAGFDKVVFIIRKDIEEAFHEAVGSRISEMIETVYVYQETDDIPVSLDVKRAKPWGTGHAVLAAADAVNEPFAVINSDDFYGRDAFEKLHEYLVSEHGDNGKIPLCMVGYVLGNTLSDNGTVTRGICNIENDMLSSLTETYEISKNGDTVSGVQNGVGTVLDENSVVSMNMWGCTTGIMSELKDRFVKFLESDVDHTKSEFVLPIEISSMIRENKAEARVLHTNEKWFGMTRSEDVTEVINEIKRLTENGVYPEKF